MSSPLETICGLILTGVVVASVFKPDTSSYSKNKVKDQYLEENLPLFKGVRDDVKHQINVCEKNIKHLQKLNESFDQTEAKRMIEEKKVHLESQKELLVQQLNKIDAETEKSMAVNAFNKVDQGGLRREVVDNVIKESQEQIFQAKRLNVMTGLYSNLSDSVVKAVPVQK